MLIDRLIKKLAQKEKKRILFLCRNKFIVSLTFKVNTNETACP